MCQGKPTSGDPGAVVVVSAIPGCRPFIVSEEFETVVVTAFVDLRFPMVVTPGLLPTQRCKQGFGGFELVGIGQAVKLVGTETFLFVAQLQQPLFGGFMAVISLNMTVQLVVVGVGLIACAAFLADANLHTPFVGMSAKHGTQVAALPA